MQYLFNGKATFNEDITAWDVSNVTDMKYMFNGASNFNQSIADWERSNSTVSFVQHMGSMFANATNFNQPIDNWEVIAVTNMQNMFKGSSPQTAAGSTEFNQNLSSWGNKFINPGSLPKASGMFTYCAVNEVQGIPINPSTDTVIWQGYNWPSV